MPSSSAVVGSDLDYIHKQVSDVNFNSKDILVTGFAGFIGYYLIHYLLEYAESNNLGKLIAIDLFKHGPPPWVQRLEAEYPYKLLVITGSAVDFDYSSPLVANTNYIIHAASIASPTFYRQYPTETIDANVLGLRSILSSKYLSENQTKILFFSSSEVYGNPHSSAIPTPEDYPGNVSFTGPRSCYDESKRLGETMCFAHSQQFGRSISIVRPFNNYGPGLSIYDRRLPSDLARHVLNNEDIMLLSDGLPTRTFCYIADAIVGYLKALLFDSTDVFNIGQDKPEISIKDFSFLFAKVASEKYGYTGKVIYGRSEDGQYNTDNPLRRCPDLSKAREQLGYDPQITLEEGISRYLDHLSDIKSS